MKGREMLESVIFVVDGHIALYLQEYSYLLRSE